MPSAFAQDKMTKMAQYLDRIYVSHEKVFVFYFILLTHEGSHREVYLEFQSSYDIFRR